MFYITALVIIAFELQIQICGILVNTEFFDDQVKTPALSYASYAVTMYARCIMGYYQLASLLSISININ